MKMKFFYEIAKTGKLWPLLCKIVDAERYDDIEK